jgi:beta-phosphoglucomutase
MVKAILFDMDGVLIDAKEWHYESLNRALSLFGSPISREDHLSLYDGLPTAVKLQQLTERGFIPNELHKFINELKQIYLNQIIYEKCKPIFSKQNALSRLKTDGYKIAVCSNSIKSSIELMMQRSKLDVYLDLILSNQDVSNPKPNPEIYVKAINSFGLTPSECLILEDNQHGLEAAWGSGAHVLQIHDIKETNYENIKGKLHELENLRCK